MRRIIPIAALVLVLATCGDPDGMSGSETTAAVVGATTTLSTTPPPSLAPSTATPPTSSAPSTSTPQAATTSTTATEADPADAGVVDPPWGEDPLTAGDVPWVLAQQWEEADNRESCSALFPADPAFGAEATLRGADFGAGWAVAWDRAEGPGRLPDGGYCADCGRGAFGVGGAGPAYGGEYARWPDQIEFRDGSRAGYGYEGDAAPSSGAPRLMYLLIPGEGCVYNIWSFISEDHLMEMVAELRFVTGLRGAPTEWVSVADPPEIVAMGEPPWAEPMLAADAVNPLYAVEWVGEAGAPGSCPMLALADLGEPAAGAKMRRAINALEMLVAWDRPSGPGHDGGGEPCDDCGRGAVGLGTFQGSTIGRGPVTRQWSDGSEAATFEGIYGTEAQLQVAGFDCTYWMWSHLGPEHLDYLMSQLRRVEGYP